MGDATRGTTDARSEDIVWAIATAGEPVTSRDVATTLDVETTRVSDKLTRLYRQGLVVRRRATQTGPGPGACRYEYALAARPSDGGDGDG